MPRIVGLDHRGVPGGVGTPRRSRCRASRVSEATGSRYNLGPSRKGLMIRDEPPQLSRGTWGLADHLSQWPRSRPSKLDNSFTSSANVLISSERSSGERSFLDEARRLRPCNL